MDIARLKFEVDSSETVTATKNTKAMTKASKDAKKSQQGLSTSSTKASRDIKLANDNIARSTNGVTRAYKAMRIGIVAALAAIGVAVTAVVRSFGSFITASVQAQQVQAQLAAALRSTGGVSGQTVASLNAHAAALQKVTLFGDEVTNSAQGVLLTFTRIRGEVFPRATKAVQDLAQALGTSLQGAAIQVGKALNDPATGLTLLTRSGITFSEAQKAVIKDLVETNQLAKAQGLILEELETQFGGSAKAARDVLGGALAGLRNAWGDLFEISATASERLRVSIEGLAAAFSNPAFIGFVQTIGTLLFGAMALAMDGLTGLVNILPKLAEYGTVAGAALLVAFGPSILAAIGSFTVAVGVGAVGAVKALTVAMIANPLGALAVGFAAAVVAAYHFRDGIKQAIGVDVIQIAKTGANFILNSFEAAYADIKFIWSNFPAVIGAAVIGAANATITGIEKMLNAASSLLDSFIDRANSALSMLPGGLQIGSIGQFDLGELDNSYFDNLSKANEGHRAKIEEIMAQNRFGGIAGMTAVDGVTTGGSLGGAADAATAAGEAIKAAAKKGLDAWKGLRKVTDETFEKMQAAANSLGNSLGGIFKGLLSGTMEWKDAALSAIQSVLSYLNSSNVAQGGAGLFGGGLFGGLAQGILGFAQGGVFNQQGVTAFARGGVVNGPAVFPFASGVGLMGESGPEAIMPLRRGPDGRLGVSNSGGSAANSNQPLRLEIVSRFDADGGFQSAVERTSRPIAQQESASASSAVAKAIPNMVDQRNWTREVRRTVA